MKRPRSTIPCPERAPWALLFLVAACAGSATANAEGPVVEPPHEVRSTTKAEPGYEPAHLAPEPPLPEPRVLVHFRDALDALGSGRRTEPVRIAWLGDSHTAADFWTDAVRTALVARFGDGGPGFVSIGRKDYRHAGVKATRDGRWHTFPRKPSLWVRQEDGV